MPALAPPLLAHGRLGALAPVLGRRLGLDRPAGALRPSGIGFARAAACPNDPR